MIASLSKSSLNRWLNALAIVFTAALFLLNSHYQLASPLFTHDLNAWLLPAIAPLRGLGMPYRDYWAIEPPALLLMTTIWGGINQSLAWFHVLYLALQAGIAGLYWRILHRLFPKNLGLILYIVGVWLYFSPAAQSMLLPSETNGLFFALLGLNIILHPRRSVRQVFLASAAFGLAGQMKEVFAFTLLALVLLYLRDCLAGWRSLIRSISATIAGLGLVGAISIGYLAATHSLGAYREVLISKSDTFQITNLKFMLGHAYRSLQHPIDRFMQADYSLLLILALTIGLSWLALSFGRIISVDRDQSGGNFLKLKLSKNLFVYSIGFSFWAGSWLGYLAQNRYGDKYDLAILFPTTILLGLISVVLSGAIGTIGRFGHRSILTGVLLLILLAPNRDFLLAPLEQARSFRLGEYVRRWRNLEDPSLLSLQQKISSSVREDDCIQGVYGWGIANLYLYSNRRPCSRFFIPNIIAADQIDEYRSSLIDHPPAALYYSRHGADLDIPNFERDVFDYGRVIRDCYQPDEEFDHLYWPRNKDPQKLRSCLQKTLILANQW